MKREQLLEAVREQITKHRYEHTLGVVDTAIRLADKYGADKEKAETAAILHDYCKFWPEDRMREIIESTPTIPKDLLEHDKELWHAHVGAEVVRSELGIEDEEILDAIRYHTSGRENMTLLEKIVCLADYIEPGRQFPGVEELRTAAEEDLDRALAKGLGGTITFLVNREKRIYPLTVLARNSLLKLKTKNAQEE
ncbi:bis(5'-nucleosyl)-tetraphosphatase (symmetrical) YqeK [Aneurinibacillus aneurinilyticus]|jgi:predicted HD superfamily hydrolase involved in NAD metabolism|uniref:bis(5'-nucleosyl)-tetraphosphatase (symmetrical) n=1 Tax=Aneurinibacillus aneurinilyticus ATCC 12856 TaxID=649747 RepID=U1WHA6_ANEAE|nr:bis(5'-nucleosyl)-tetraphosphatase (symmetrical) YqeK [Aneurinibacillus aneurinilyticus]ERI07954.1 hydrolase, HD family [Aneurinibacillus aneurinilyticus ATCC 12856]MCI1694340.1 bis(5'-nucleosyl)-tetraphosphatase (symmetrical) YqeK [Aneurinibacillus aneurinilyticus]MED0705407.1 bis(5'-nucleosyl)-tetraphosphatase (symmetrical) YqeK [Aneurinibacillus aneurinilyticus]MED0724974.1 bis(5'-nucleosyl)-tetraphosphatase (symmetrical) YqeK [Aneurinibacillus aneurinilyticus]MED0731004.1 bis(5'-nucleos